VCLTFKLKNKRPTWCHLLFYFTSLNYHIGRIVLGSMCVGDSVWLGWSGICLAGWSTASAWNTDRTKNKTTDVVIQQNSRKLLMMDILMSETCWTHKKWNKMASDIRLVFYSSTKLESSTFRDLCLQISWTFLGRN